jgi:ABC-type amino acid transport substrate-binding protein
MVAMIGTTWIYFSVAVKNEYDKDQVITNMQSLIYPVDREIYKPGDTGFKPVDLSKPALERIREKEVLHVGYRPDALPWSYFSEIGELIGFDVDMAQLLARELGVKLVFIPYDTDRMAAQLDAGRFDLIMSGLIITTPRLENMIFSDPYMETTLSFVVPDHRRNDFGTEEAILNIGDLRIGLPEAGDYFEPKLRRYLPNAEIVRLDSIQAFFEGHGPGVDALLLDAESGSAWSLIYPRYQPIVPVPDIVRLPVAYPVAGRDTEFARFLSQWIKLKQSSGAYQKLYDHWVLGLHAEPQKPRWTILRDVLKWVKDPSLEGPTATFTDGKEQE